MGRVVRTMGLKLHPQATCECGLTWGSSDIARDLAKDHAQQSGHTVVVETITRDVYRVVDR